MDLRGLCVIASVALVASCSEVPPPEQTADQRPPEQTADQRPPEQTADQRPAEPVPHTVVIIGSSTAAGVGASSPAKSWGGRISTFAAERCPKTKIVNLGVGGYTTWHGMPAAAVRPSGRPASDAARNVEAALALRPSLVMILFPSNDAASRFPLAETLSNQTALRDSVRRAGAAEMIIGPFPRRFTEANQIALMTGLRDQLPAIGAPRYLALWEVFAAADDAVQTKYSAGDGVHLNDSGHAVIAERVLASAAFVAVCPAAAR